MQTPKADHTPAPPAPPGGVESELHREIRALLECPDGIDESRAKRLRKQRLLCQDAGGEDSALAALFERLRERVHSQVELREKQFAQVEEHLRQLRASLSNGDLERARQLEKTVMQALDQITRLSKQRRRKVIAELEALQPELHKLSGWRRWGTIQAREKMIREIRDIHKSGATLEEIARRIRQARQEWRDWDQAGEGASRKLQALFEHECTTAYRPCQAHFDEQKRRHRQNSRARDQICLFLEQEFSRIEWRAIDWKKLQQLVRSQTGKWHSVGPAEYKLRKILQRRFDAIMEKFNDPLDRERRRNYKMREKLIADIEQLAQSENTRAALAELQVLKKKWAPTVTSSHRREREIWKRFTDACDKVFAKRDREREDLKRTLRENLAARESLCAEIETRCRSDSQTHLEIGAHLKRWRARWDELGEAPKASAEKINKRYRHAMRRAQRMFDKTALDEQIRRHNLLRQKSLLCARLEAQALAGGCGGRGAGDPDRLSDRWKALPPLPGDLEQAIGERYRLACAAIVDAAALQRLRASIPAHVEVLHARLLQLEILVEVDSPAAFSRQRMALQIERLSAALGNREAGQGKPAGQLIEDILVAGAVPEREHAAALERLDRCLVKQGQHRDHDHQKHDRDDAAGL
ncbi:MAG: DUF349 domain-containing protein [Gammaproteobacteria bacterium]|nr:DUF349 domain-containing protein [Gammaproteobacteria bacterium]